MEPDGDPNPQNVPTSTSHFNIYYHLGLAHYLKGDFEKALAAYRECLKYSTSSDDRLVATTDWLYMTLRRLGREDEAARVLQPITRDLKVLENHSYWNRLLMYKGEKTPEELLGPATTAWSWPRTVTASATGICTTARRSARGRCSNAWWPARNGPAFGFIAAEVELRSIE